MKKIKILYFILCVIVIILSISIVTDFIFTLYMKSTFEEANQNTILGYLTQFVYPALYTILILGLIFILLGLRAMIQLGGFNSKSTTNFKYSGIAIGSYGMAYLIFQLNFINTAETYRIFTNSVTSIFIVIVGFGIYSFSEILRSGERLKEENDLTV